MAVFLKRNDVGSSSKKKETKKKEKSVGAAAAASLISDSVPMLRRHRRALWLGALLALGQLGLAAGLFDEPRPLAVWEDPVQLPASFKKPTTWSEKNFGQWCRNFTANRHKQCPQGSPFHWYYCCGDTMTDCCAAAQTWTIVVFGSLFVSTAFLLVLSILAHLDLIWSQKDKPQTISVLKYNPVISPA